MQVLVGIPAFMGPCAGTNTGDEAMTGILSRIVGRMRHGKADSQFIEEMRAVLADGELDDEERHQLALRHVELGAGDAWNDVKADLYLAAVRGALKGGRLTPEAEGELAEIRGYLQVGPAEAERGNTLLGEARDRLAAEARQLKAKADWEAYLTALRRAEGPRLEVGNIMFQRGERALLEVPMAALEYKAIARQHVGGSTGFNIRVARGVSFRVGGMRGYSVPVMGLQPLSTGRLVITTRRLVFAGMLAGWSDPLEKIISVTPYADVFQYVVHGRVKPRILRYEPGAHPEAIMAAFEGAVNASALGNP